MNLHGLARIFRHAFAIDTSTSFDEEEISLLNKVAKAVVGRGLASPALIFLESVKPMNFVGSQLMLFLEPIISIVVDTKEYERLALIFEKRGSIEKLIQLIEENIHEPRRN